MSKYVTKKFVNWIDGMKVNKEHFVQESHAIWEHTRDAISVPTNLVNYGILPPDSLGQASLKFHLEASNEKNIPVKIIECQAVTYGGCRISIVNREQNPLNQIVDIPANVDKEMYLIISVNPLEKSPFGEIDPEEEPPRFPLLEQVYRLHIVDMGDFSSHVSPYQLILGKLYYQNGLLQVDTNYVPPCTSIISHPKLVEQHIQIINYLLSIEYASLQIIQKILLKKQNNTLALLVKHTCENILLYLNSNLVIIKQSCLYRSPFELVCLLAGLAKSIKSTIDIYHGIGKEELLNYLSDWLDITQVDFEKISSEVINLDYKHQNCQESLQKQLIYLERMATLYKKLADLDYIGKKDATDIWLGYTPEQHFNWWQRIVKRLFTV